MQIPIKNGVRSYTTIFMNQLMNWWMLILLILLLIYLRFRIYQKMKTRENDHSKALFDAVQAGFLYFLDQEDKYAQFAADILSHYTLQISLETGNLYFSKTGHWIESRDLYPKVGMTYDFIQPFLMDSGTTIYNLKTAQRELFNQDKAQASFIKLADEVFNRGNTGSNHPMLEASGALFNLLVIEEDSVRNEYFDKFMNGTPNQDGLHLMLQTIKDHDFYGQNPLVMEKKPMK